MYIKALNFSWNGTLHSTVLSYSIPFGVDSETPYGRRKQEHKYKHTNTHT